MVNTLQIPSGQASVNRLLSLAKGLAEKKVNVTIFSTAKGQDRQFHSMDGIKYCNLQRNGYTIINLVRSLYDIVSYIRKTRFMINAVWVVSNSPFLLIPLWLICRLYKIPYIQEKSEYPFILMKDGLIAKIWGKIYVNTLYKCFDGMVIMTEPLLQYFKPLVRKKCKLIKCPMTVDMSRFENVSSNNEYGDYAAYCGNMSGNKDGVENLIEAFSYVEKLYPDFKLVMVGSTDSEKEFERITTKVKTMGLNNVIFTGRVDRDSIPGILINAKMLCLARPSSLQSMGGFPTKLGEYLSTGHPVVVTAVGEIPSFLNRTNSYIVKPDNNQAFGEAMIEILQDYEKASIIGMKGKQVALDNFNYKAQGEKLFNYIVELNKNGK